MNNLRQESQMYKLYAYTIVPSFHDRMSICCWSNGFSWVRVYIIRPCFTFSSEHTVLASLMPMVFLYRHFYICFFFFFIFIKLPVCKSPSQNHDLFYAVQMLCFALVLFFVCLSFWFKPTRRVYLFTVCVYVCCRFGDLFISFFASIANVRFDLFKILIGVLYSLWIIDWG